MHDNQTTQSAQSALKAVAEAARQLFVADQCLAAPVNPVTRQFNAPFLVAGADTRQPSRAPDDALLMAIGQEGLERDELCTLYHAEEIDGERLPPGLERIRTLFVIPLRAAGDNKPLAILWLGFLKPRSFTAEDEGRLDSFRVQFTPFLRNVWQSQRLQQVVLLGQEVNHALRSVEELFRTVRSRVADILDVSYFFMLALHQPQIGRLDLYHSFQGGLNVIHDAALSGACGWVIEHKTALTIASRSEHMSTGLTLLGMESTGDAPESLIFVPLMLRNVALGALSVQHPSSHAYDASDLEIISLLANQIALAVGNLRLFDHLQSLNETGQSLTQLSDSAELPRIVVDLIRRTTNADVVILYPYNQARGQFEQATDSGSFLQPEFSPSSATQPDDIAHLVLAESVPVYAVDSSRLYELLGGGAAVRRGNFEEREAIASTAILPLRVSGETTGVLFVNYRQPQLFDATQRMLIESLVNHAAIAVRNSRTFLTLANRRIDELEALRHIGLSISKSLDLEQVLATILQSAVERVPVDEAAIFLYDPRHNALEAVTSVGSKAQQRRAHVISLEHGESLLAYVFKNKLPLMTGNVHTGEWSQRYYRLNENTVSEMDVPLLDGNECIGVINLESVKESAFTPADLEFLIILAGQAVLAIRNAQAYKLAADQSRRFQLLYEAGQELGQITDSSRLQQAYNIVLDKLGKFSNGEVVIRRYNPGKRELVLVCAGRQRQPAPVPSIPISEGVNGQVARELRTIRLNDISNLPPGVAQPIRNDPAIKTLVVTPIIFERSYYGNLVLSHEQANSFNNADAMLIEGLARQLAITINRLETLQARREAEVMSQLGHSAMELTHRLSNELGLVKMYVNSALRAAEAQGIDSGPIKDNLDKITRDVTGVLSMSKELRMTIAGLGRRDNSGKRAMTPVKSLLEDARRSLKTLPANVSVIWPSDIPQVSIPVIPGLIIDILYNLITNAVEAMPDGGKVFVRACISGSEVLIEVSDTGPGVPNEARPKLFNLFYSTKKSSGFGLWSARQYARANGGALHYEQREGGGATFVLHLPITVALEGTA